MHQRKAFKENKLRHYQMNKLASIAFQFKVKMGPIAKDDLRNTTRVLPNVPVLPEVQTLLEMPAIPEMPALPEMPIMPDLSVLLQPPSSTSVGLEPPMEMALNYTEV